MIHDSKNYCVTLNESGGVIIVAVGRGPGGGFCGRGADFGGPGGGFFSLSSSSGLPLLLLSIKPSPGRPKPPPGSQKPPPVTPLSKITTLPRLLRISK